jgi:peptidoglycan/LPS O-acetylase OafA/YrhL
VASLNALVVILFFIDLYSYTFAVPLFIFCSGFVLSVKYTGSFSKFSFWKKRLRFILPPYIIFSIFYLVYDYGIYSVLSLNTIPSMVLTQLSTTFLWFVPLIIQFYLLYPFLIRIYDYLNDQLKLKLLFALALAVQMLWNIITFVQPIGAAIPFVSHILYFLLGIYTAKNFKFITSRINKIKIFKILVLSLIFMAPIVLIWLIRFNYIESSFKTTALYSIVPVCLMLPLSLFILILCIRASLHLNKTDSFYARGFGSLGRLSFGMYLIHLLLISTLSNRLKNFGLTVNDWSYYLLLFLMTVLLSYLIVYLLNFVPHSEILIGTHALATNKQESNDIGI